MGNINIFFQKIVKTLCLALYYGVAIHFPTQPVPTYQVGYWLRRYLLKGIAQQCGQDIIVKHNCYIGSGHGLVVGDRTQLGQNARIDQAVRLGNDVVMGPDVVIMTNAHRFDAVDVPINQQGNFPLAPVTIGNDVWLGTRVVVLPGVTIGDGAVIGAGSIVTKDIPPLSVAVGNPAKVLRQRGQLASSRREDA